MPKGIYARSKVTTIRKVDRKTADRIRRNYKMGYHAKILASGSGISASTVLDIVNYAGCYAEDRESENANG